MHICFKQISFFLKLQFLLNKLNKFCSFLMNLLLNLVMMIFCLLPIVKSFVQISKKTEIGGMWHHACSMHLLKLRKNLINRHAVYKLILPKILLPPKRYTITSNHIKPGETSSNLINQVNMHHTSLGMKQSSLLPGNCLVTVFKIRRFFSSFFYEFIYFDFFQAFIIHLDLKYSFEILIR